MASLLTTQTVIPYLIDRGLVNISDSQTSRELQGGVSNVVLAVENETTRVVVKQSLSKLKVRDEWLAPVERIVSEAFALKISSEAVPGCSPRLIDSDESRFAITMDMAPRGWTDWKTRLMAGQVQPIIGSILGERLGLLHSKTTEFSKFPASFLRQEAFDALRIDPYYRAAARNVPEVEEAINSIAAEISSVRLCMVHGDFSPKNILVGPDPTDLWLIDWEVAHFGDPAFDLAFLLTHLILKSIHMPEKRALLDSTALEFIKSYSSFEGGFEIPFDRISSHLGCLLVARVKGKSPAEYLSPDDAMLVLRLGIALLKNPLENVEEVLELRDRTK